MQESNKIRGIALIIFGLLIIFATLFTPVKNKEVKLISDFPSVPVYPSATLISTYSEQVEVIKVVVYNAVWSSNGSVDDISSWYIKSLNDQNWVIHVPKNEVNKDLQYMVFKRDPDVLQLSLEKMYTGETKITVDVYHYLYKLIYPEEENNQ